MLSDLKKFAKDNHFSFSKENLYEDKISGFKNEKERDGLNKLLNAVGKDGIKYVFGWSIPLREFWAV